MAAFHRAGLERINAFEVDGRYLFKRYFDDESIFRRLGRYYNNRQYRFEVPSAAIDDVRSFLADNGYALTTVDAKDAFVVAVRQYTAHPENIFRDSVAHRSGNGYNFFLMAEQEAVDRSVADGATNIDDLDVASPF